MDTYNQIDGYCTKVILKIVTPKCELTYFTSRPICYGLQKFSLYLSLLMFVTQERYGT